MLCQHRPILPCSRPQSIVGTNELNFRVRDGNGWTLIVNDTDCMSGCSSAAPDTEKRTGARVSVQALGLLVSVSSMHCCTYTPDLSTCSLQVTLLTFVMGYLILRCVSRLDAFSVYRIHTRLPGRAPGGTTGAPEVCPSRSSRTKDSASQISYAHDR